MSLIGNTRRRGDADCIEKSSECLKGGRKRTKTNEEYSRGKSVAFFAGGTEPKNHRKSLIVQDILIVDCLRTKSTEGRRLKNFEG